MTMQIKFIITVIPAFLAFSCCTDSTIKNQNENVKQPVVSSPQTVAINKSIVKIKVKKIDKKENNLFFLTGAVLSVEADSAYPSIAVVGQDYVMKPAYVMDENNQLVKDNIKNSRLLSLTNLDEGNEFEAVISFSTENGWIIYEVIKED